MAKKWISTNSNEHKLFNEIDILVEQSKKQLVVQVNNILTLTYWQVGNKMNDHNCAKQKSRL